MSISVGDKYVIEIGAVAELPEGKKKYFIKPFESLVFDRKDLEQLEKFDGLALKEYDLGYKKGFEDGKNEAIHNTDLIEELKQMEYSRGLEDAWKLAQKVELLTCGEVVQIFGEQALTQFGEDNNPEVFGLINQYSYKDCSDRIKAYEDNKKAEVNDHHFIVDSLRNLIDDYGTEKVAKALPEFGIEVKDV